MVSRFSFFDQQPLNIVRDQIQVQSPALSSKSCLSNTPSSADALNHNHNHSHPLCLTLEAVSSNTTATAREFELEPSLNSRSSLPGLSTPIFAAGLFSLQVPLPSDSENRLSFSQHSFPSDDGDSDDDDDDEPNPSQLNSLFVRNRHSSHTNNTPNIANNPITIALTNTYSDPNPIANTNTNISTNTNANASTNTDHNNNSSLVLRHSKSNSNSNHSNSHISHISRQHRNSGSAVTVKIPSSIASTATAEYSYSPSSTAVSEYTQIDTPQYLSLVASHSHHIPGLTLDCQNTPISESSQILHILQEIPALNFDQTQEFEEEEKQQTPLVLSHTPPFIKQFQFKFDFDSDSDHEYRFEKDLHCIETDLRLSLNLFDTYTTYYHHNNNNNNNNTNNMGNCFNSDTTPNPKSPKNKVIHDPNDSQQNALVKDDKTDQQERRNISPKKNHKMTFDEIEIHENGNQSEKAKLKNNASSNNKPPAQKTFQSGHSPKAAVQNTNNNKLRARESPNSGSRSDHKSAANKALRHNTANNANANANATAATTIIQIEPPGSDEADADSSNFNAVLPPSLDHTQSNTRSAGHAIPHEVQESRDKISPMPMSSAPALKANFSYGSKRQSNSRTSPANSRMSFTPRGGQLSPLHHVRASGSYDNEDEFSDSKDDAEDPQDYDEIATPTGFIKEHRTIIKFISKNSTDGDPALSGRNLMNRTNRRKGVTNAKHARHNTATMLSKIPVSLQEPPMSPRFVGSGLVLDRPEEFLKETLSGNLLFSGVDAEFRDKMIDKVTEMLRPAMFKANDILIKQGDEGDAFYLIESGSFEIIVSTYLSPDKSHNSSGGGGGGSGYGPDSKSANNKREMPFSPAVVVPHLSRNASQQTMEKVDKVVAVAGSGTCVGEYALLYNQPRTATLMATQESKVWGITAEQFHEMRQEIMQWNVERFVNRQKFLKEIVLFQQLQDHQVLNLTHACYAEIYDPDEYIIFKNEPNSNVYVIMEGDVLIETCQRSELPPEAYHESDICMLPPGVDAHEAAPLGGALALDTEQDNNNTDNNNNNTNNTFGFGMSLNLSRDASGTGGSNNPSSNRISVIADEDDNDHEDDGHDTHNNNNNNDNNDNVFVEPIGIGIGIGVELSAEKEDSLPKVSIISSFGNNNATGQRSSIGFSFGLGLDPVDNDTEQVYSVRDFFARSLIKDESVEILCARADTQVKVLKIERDDFLFIMAQNVDESTATAAIQGVDDLVGNDFLPDRSCNTLDIALEELKPLCILGIGSFGKVQLVKHPRQTETYALKEVKKRRVIETGQEEHIINEKRVLAMLDSPFCVKLFATFQTPESVYFLTEVVLGGELFTVLRYNSKFDKNSTRFYAGCVILALEHLHSKDIIYRDLKPENLLLSRNGYLKLTDFGFAKKRNTSCTLCGTPQYLAPEVIHNWVQSFATDWWALGVLLYEMVVGHPPFEDDENVKMYEKILQSDPEFTEDMHPKLRHLIQKLLDKNSYLRLGSGIQGALEVKNHHFFAKKLDWDALLAQTLDPPYKPEVTSNCDAQNFDNFSDYESESDEDDTPLEELVEEYELEWTEHF